jgi:hypothetical protein
LQVATPFPAKGVLIKYYLILKMPMAISEQEARKQLNKMKALIRLERNFAGHKYLSIQRGIVD